MRGFLLQEQFFTQTKRQNPNMITARLTNETGGMKGATLGV